MNIGEICSRNLVSAPAAARLADVAQLMRSEHVGIVVITKAPLDQPVAVGVITDRDLVRAQVERADFERLRAEDVMTREPLVLCEDLALAEAIERMRARAVRRAPVVNTHGMPIGIVSTDDLIGELARELRSLASLLERQPRREH
jgi:CBS domain-containing protein